MNFSRRVSDATHRVFGDSPIAQAVDEACQKYEHDLQNIQAGRGINALLIAIVGAKGQGKTWVARQFVQDEKVQGFLRSGDLIDDATTRLVWVGPVAPESLDAASEIYHPCPVAKMVHMGQPYVLLDTPGLTDADQRAARLAEEALSLAPVKLLVVAREQIRAAANMSIAHQVDGSVCIPVITSVEPEEMPQTPLAQSANERALAALQDDLRGLRDQLSLMAPRVVLGKEVLIADFEITGDETAASQQFLGNVLDRMNELGLTELTLASTREHRVLAANQRLRREVARLIGNELPQLASAVEQLNRETELVPERVLASLLGSESVLETGIRMRLRARLVSDTSLLWFPYRTVMSTLNLTQGSWDRVMLALAGSVPSLFGALASWARNARLSREFSAEIHEGIRKRTQEQVQERLRPLCNQFHQTVMKLRPRSERAREEVESAGMRLAGVEELQSRSQQMFDAAIDRNATKSWLVQIYAFLGVIIFWVLMAGPIVLIYEEYLVASVQVLTGQESHLEAFPHPTPGLLLTSLFLSTLPLAIYCMLVLTWSLSRARIRKVAMEIVTEHDQTIAQLKSSNVIRLDFEDPLLAQAEFLLNLREHES